MPKCFAVVGAIFLSATFAIAQDQGTPAPPNVIPQGTVFLIQITDRLDTHSVKAGDHFQGKLAEDLTTPGGLLIATGRHIKGHVSAVEPGMRNRLLLSFDEIDTGHGWVPLMATVTGVPGEHGLQEMGRDGEIGRKGPSKEQIAEAVIVGAGEGASDGMHKDGKRGAAAGAGNGAANAGFTAFESGHDLILEKGTALEIRLDRNITLR